MPSLRKAINDHCKSCGYDSKSGLGSWRKQVEDCPCTQCHLFPVRPKTLPKRPDSNAQAGYSNTNTGDL